MRSFAHFLCSLLPLSVFKFNFVVKYLAWVYDKNSGANLSTDCF